MTYDIVYADSSHVAWVAREPKICTPHEWKSYSSLHVLEDCDVYNLLMIGWCRELSSPVITQEEM